MRGARYLYTLSFSSPTLEVIQRLWKVNNTLPGIKFKATQPETVFSPLATKHATMVTAGFASGHLL
jgi:hypothetical protein